MGSPSSALGADPTVPPPSAIITGGSRGIGYGIARHLAAQGWSLTVTARNPDRLTEVRREFEDLGARVATLAGDMADEAAVTDLIACHQESNPSLSALVLAAGVGSAAPLEKQTLRRFDKQFAVNVRAPFALVTASIPLLRAAAAADPDRGARVVALTSMEGLYPDVGLAAYSASKAALISLVRSINLEESGHRIAATAISPGYVDTDMSDWVKGSIPAESMIKVDDIVRIVDLVLSISVSSVIPHVVINRAGSAHHA